MFGPLLIGHPCCKGNFSVFANVGVMLLSQFDKGRKALNMQTKSVLSIKSLPL